jgi:transcriptional regulator with XRE-family HTH domain
MENKVYLNIKKIRELSDYTREYMSAELNMSTSGYGKIERGEVDLTLSKLLSICKVLEVTVVQLLFFDATTLFSADKKIIKDNDDSGKNLNDSK